MKTENAVLMKTARESLRGRWGLAMGVLVLYVVLVSIFNGIPKVGGLASLVVTGPLSVGAAIFVLSFSRSQEARLEQLFKGFENFGTSLAAYLLMLLFVLLWSLLLIIPGIIAALSYAMVFFIIAEDPSIGAMDALKKSKEMMYGYKWKYLCLKFRFLGWAILSILTAGIGFLWLIPYVQVSAAKFYDDIKGGDNVAQEAAPEEPAATQETTTPEQADAAELTEGPFQSV